MKQSLSVQCNQVGASKPIDNVAVIPFTGDNSGECVKKS